MLLFRRTAAVFLGLVPLLLVVVAVVIVVGEVRPRDPSWYSVRDENVLGHAFTYAVAGCVGLFGCRRLWRTDAGWKWALVPVAVMLAGVAIPNFEYGHHGSPLDRASFNMLQRLATFAASSKQLAQEQGRFTCDPSAEQFGPSRYIHNGRRLPYVVLCVPNATGPALGSPPERPGTLVFAVSADRKQAWFTATVLARGADQHATWLTRQGQPAVITFSVQATH